ncbi:MAG: dTMP kinase [Planctomycetes bacterium]|nr:dTMP kinase [Planctomycetota bacterium]
MFYVFEGGDGVGKSTQLGLLKRYLEVEAGRRVYIVREPGGTDLGERLREILLAPESGDLSPQVEVFLFMAARAHLCEKEIRPALRRGRVVLADRFLWSSVVYQGVAGGLGLDEVLRLGAIATSDVRPTRIFVLDLDPDLAFGRFRDRDRMESRPAEFHRRVRDGYLALARRFPAESLVLDGSLPAEELHELVVQSVRRDLEGGAT